MDKDIKKIIEFVGNGDPMFETEYAGRMEHYCFYCGAYQERAEVNHEKDCLHLLAEKLIKKII